MGYKELQGVTTGYKGIQLVTGDYEGIEGLEWVTRSYIGF